MTEHTSAFRTYGGADGKRLVEAVCSCGWESQLYSSGDTAKAEHFAEDEHSLHVAGEEWLSMIANA